MNAAYRHRGDGARDGVALVIVLGVLSVVVTLAVAFAITMRNERQASGHYMGDIMGKYMLDSALSRALLAMEEKLGDDMYPSWDVLVSSNQLASRASLLVGEMAEFVPKAMHEEVAGADVYWETLLSPDENAVMFGSVSYCVINCSGLLDANAVGAAGSDGVRRFGTNVNEVSLQYLPDFTDADNFIDNRNKDVRYETAADLYRANVSRSSAESGMTNWPSNLVAYSRNPPGRWDEVAGAAKTNVVYIGGDATSLSNDASRIDKAFEDSGVPVQMFRTTLVDALLDYVDSDHIPRNFQNGTVEAVPMINEIWLAHVFTTDGTNWTSILVPRVELSYPFLTPSTNDFELHYSLTFTDGGGGNVVNPADVPMTAVTPKLVAPLHQEQFPVWALPIVNTAGNASPLSPPAKFDIEFRLEVRLGADVVDVVPAAGQPALKITIDDIGELAAADSDPLMKFTASMDARFNGQTQFWFADDSPGPPTAATLGSVNDITVFGRNAGASQGVDQHGYAHVANRPLHSVGELSYLAFFPLQTIRMMNTNGPPYMHTVLDHFTLRPEEAALTKGLVNPNSRHEDVWHALYRDMPVNDYVSELIDSPHLNPTPSTNTLDAAIVDKIVEKLEEAQTREAFTNVSDLGKIDFSSLTNDFPTTFQNEFDVEGVVRNVAGMFSTRQNLFVIMLGAQPYVQVQGPFVWNIPTVPQFMGVAVVWRDPYTKQSFVRHFKRISN